MGYTHTHTHTHTHAHTVEYIYNGIWHKKDYPKLTVFVGKDVYALLKRFFFFKAVYKTALIVWSHLFRVIQIRIPTKIFRITISGWPQFGSFDFCCLFI